jgi:hypothetical protein
VLVVLMESGKEKELKPSQKPVSVCNHYCLGDFGNNSKRCLKNDTFLRIKKDPKKAVFSEMSVFGDILRHRFLDPSPVSVVVLKSKLLARMKKYSTLGKVLKMYFFRFLSFFSKML